MQIRKLKDCSFGTAWCPLSRHNQRSKDYMVDIETAQVSVRGRAKFIWRSTGRAWQESQKDITNAVSITRTETIVTIVDFFFGGPII